jgi:glycosyltransferase involved in cell wall biosynthesis
MGLKLLQITPAFYPATYWGGPIYSVYGLCNALAENSEVELRVLTTDTAGPQLSESVEVTGFPMTYPPGYEVFFCHRQWGASYSTEMFRQLWTMIRWADVVHLTSVYSPPTIPTLLLCRILGKPLVWSPRGALQRWEQSTNRLSKKVWELICNALAKPEQCLLHVTSEGEAVESSRRISRAAISVIRNGIEMPSDIPEREWRPAGQLRITYMGRLHPIKGIEQVIAAVQYLANGTVNLNIFGVGEEDYSQSLRELVERLGLQHVVSFKGHVTGRDKLQAFLHTDICVVPSFSENFAMVVAEALAHAVPVIASKGTPWQDLEKHGCGLWVENSPEELAQAITRLAACPLYEMGIRGRIWMKDYYSWDKVSAEMLFAYRRLVAQA